MVGGHKHLSIDNGKFGLEKGALFRRVFKAPSHVLLWPCIEIQ